MLDQAVATAAAEPVAGGPGTFADRIRENQSMVFSIAYHSLRDYSLAEEVAQDVFLELHKRFGTFDSPLHVRNWLRTVVANRCIDQSRRRKLRPQLGLDEVREPASPPPPGDPLLETLLGRLVASLPEKHRMVLILRYQEDLDPVEIAGTLHMRLGTVRSHLRRSLGILRQKMARAGGGTSQ
jgi:RNA polymerase sigma-70 factor (ECF subfamily)